MRTEQRVISISSGLFDEMVDNAARIRAYERKKELLGRGINKSFPLVVFRCHSPKNTFIFPRETAFGL